MSDFAKNALTWFSIPTKDFEKSVKFYEELLDVELIRHMMGEGDEAMPFAMFPKESEQGVTGAVTPDDRYEPAKGGVVVYLYCKDIDGSLARVEDLGGAVVTGKTVLPEMGHIAVVADCFGTPVGLHQP